MLYELTPGTHGCGLLQYIETKKRNLKKIVADNIQINASLREFVAWTDKEADAYLHDM